MCGKNDKTPRPCKSRLSTQVHDRRDRRDWRQLWPPVPSVTPVTPVLFLSSLPVAAGRQRGAGRFARLGKRVAARGCARARRAAGGFACEHASALGPASAMRCIAATRLGNPLRGIGKPHGKRLDGEPFVRTSTHLRTSQNFLSRRNGGLPNPARRGKPRRGWGKALAADGELVHRAVGGPRPKPSKTAPRPAGFPGRAKR